MAVDANVLIYERIREELRNGVSPQAAIRAGFEKAFSAIADSNVTTLIAGVVLWVFGTGADPGLRRGADARHRHFDVHRAHGQPRAAHADVRRQAQGRAASRSADGAHARGIFHKKTNFPFMATRKVWYGLSAVLMLGSFVSFFTRGLNFAIDFTGGVSVEATFPKHVGRRRGARRARSRRASTSRRCRPSAHRATSRSACSPPGRPPTSSAAAVRDGARRASIRARRSPRSRWSGPQVGDELRRLSAIWALAFTLLLHRHLHHPALPHLAAVARRHPRGAARPDPGARRVLDHADAVRSRRGRGHPRGHRLLAERHRDRVRPHPRALRDQPAPGAATSMLDQAINQTLSRTIMTKVVTSHRRGGAAVPRRPGAARLLRGAAHRHHRRHVFVHLHLERGRADLRPQGRARVPAGTQKTAVDELP